MANKKDIIQSVSPLEFVRMRPDVYLGGSSTPNQLVREAVSNAVDLHKIGECDRVEIELKENGDATICDNGPGFPINEKRDDGKTTLQASFDTLNTSGKYNDDGIYEGDVEGING